MIYGLPTQTIEELKYDIDYLLGLDDKVNIDISSLSEEAKAAILKVIEIFLEKK